MIRVDGLYKKFGATTVLTNAHAQIAKGECIAAIGPSGSGKSVFLRCIAMLERPDAGSVCINGVDITQKGTDLNKVREKMGMVYQGFHLFSHLNVLDNITLAPRWVKKQGRIEAERKAMELLSMISLVDKAKSYPHQLSGGQQQRVAIARCLAMEPEIMLFDEPTSALDPAMTGEVLAIIRKLTKMGLTMLIVTHEMAFARDVADRVFYVDEGCIYEEGTPEEIFDRPRKEKTRAFISRQKIFAFKISSTAFDMTAMNAQIEVFFNKYNIPLERIYNVQLVLEELIMEIFMQCYRTSQPDIEFTVAYLPENDEISICLNYVADPVNPLVHATDNEDELGIVLVKKFSTQHEYLYANGKNQIVITL